MRMVHNPDRSGCTLDLLDLVDLDELFFEIDVPVRPDLPDAHKDIVFFLVISFDARFVHKPLDPVV